MKTQPIFVFFGHHKCASSWIQRIIWNVFADAGRSYVAIRGNSEADLADSFRREQACLRPSAVGFPNCKRAYIDLLPDFQGIHVVRDPRDILVSGYFSHLKSHRFYEDTSKEYIEHRNRLQQVGLREGLMMELDGPLVPVFQDMMDWQPGESHNIQEVKMEEITAHPLREFCSLLEGSGWQLSEPNKLAWYFLSRTNQACRRFFGGSLFKDLPLQRQSVEWHVERLSFTKLTGRKPGEEDSNSHLRKGIAGDWKNYFWTELGQKFNERYGDLLLKYGYETDDKWLRGLETQAPNR